MPEPIVHVSDDAVVIGWPRGPMHRVTPEGVVTEQYSFSAIDDHASVEFMPTAEAFDTALAVVRERAQGRRLAPATIAALTEEIDT